MLNPQSPIPLYRQLADLLRDGIRSGEYPAGTRVPSEHRLADRFGIGRPTVRQAIDVLVREQLLARKRGSGTFVREEIGEVDLFSLAGTISSFHKKGLKISTKILSKTRRKGIAAKTENPFSGKEAFFFSRLSLVESSPVLIEDLYLDPVLFKGFDGFDMAGQSLSRIVSDRYYMKPTHGKQNFRIGYLSGKRAGALNISETTPVLAVERFLHFSDAENAIYSELFCRTDRFVFSQSIGGMTNEA